MSEDSNDYNVPQVLNLEGADPVRKVIRDKLGKPALDEPWVENKRTGGWIPKSVADARAEATRANNTPLQRERRRKIREAQTAEIIAITDALGDIPTPERLSFAQCLAEARAFRDWLRIDAPRQRQFRRHGRLYLAARIVAQEMRLELWGDPEPAAFAPRLSALFGKPIDRRAARNILSQLREKLEVEGGPWPPVVTNAAQPSLS